MNLQNDYLIISPFAEWPFDNITIRRRPEGPFDHIIICRSKGCQNIYAPTIFRSPTKRILPGCPFLRYSMQSLFFWLVRANPEDIRSLWMIRTPSSNHLSFCLKTASLFNEKYLLYCKKLADNTNTFVESSRLLFENCPFSHLNIFFHNSRQTYQVMLSSIFYRPLKVHEYEFLGFGLGIQKMV